MSTVAVVGAGLAGRLAALQLAGRGFAVTLLEKGNSSGSDSAAMAAGGLLTPLGESIHCAPWIVEMGFASLQLWPQLLQGLDKWVYFQQQGSLLVSHAQDSGDMLRFTRHLNSHWPQHPVQSLDRQQLNELEPELGRNFNGGVFLPGEGQIDNRQLMDVLAQQIEKSSVQWQCHHPIEDVQVLQNDFNWVIDCRGTGAAEQLEGLRGVRGELFQLLAPEVKLSRPVRLMHPRYHLYIAPKPNNHYIIGATEIESDDESPMTVRSALELLSAAYSVHPGFAEATILQQVNRTRPAFADNHPKIKIQDNLISVNGLYRHGFLIAPVVIQHLMQLIEVKTANRQGHYLFADLIEEVGQ